MSGSTLSASKRHFASRLALRSWRWRFSSCFWVGAAGQFDLDLALNITPDPGESKWLPHGVMGVLAAMPFAIWFFLAIEQLPLAAEEAQHPQRDLPKGMIYGIATLIVTAVVTLVLNSGVAPGAEAVGASSEPLLVGFESIFGTTGKVLSLLAVAGLVASFHSIIFAYGRQIYSLSRAGYFPRLLSLTHSRRKTPHAALIGGAVIGYAVALLIFLLGEDHPVGAMLLNMAVFGAVLAYALQMLSYIVLRVRRADIERPYVSPLELRVPASRFCSRWSALLPSS